LAELREARNAEALRKIKKLLPISKQSVFWDKNRNKSLYDVSPPKDSMNLEAIQKFAEFYGLGVDKDSSNLPDIQKSGETSFIEEGKHNIVGQNTLGSDNTLPKFSTLRLSSGDVPLDMKAQFLTPRNQELKPDSENVSLLSPETPSSAAQNHIIKYQEITSTLSKNSYYDEELVVNSPIEEGSPSLIFDRRNSVGPLDMLNIAARTKSIFSKYKYDNDTITETKEELTSPSLKRIRKYSKDSAITEVKEELNASSFRKYAKEQPNSARKASDSGRSLRSSLESPPRSPPKISPPKIEIPLKLDLFSGPESKQTPVDSNDTTSKRPLRSRVTGRFTFHLENMASITVREKEKKEPDNVNAEVLSLNNKIESLENSLGSIIDKFKELSEYAEELKKENTRLKQTHYNELNKYFKGIKPNNVTSVSTAITRPSSKGSNSIDEVGDVPIRKATFIISSSDKQKDKEYYQEDRKRVEGRFSSYMKKKIEKPIKSIIPLLATKSQSIDGLSNTKDDETNPFAISDDDDEVLL
jgi:hypothetical protein